MATFFVEELVEVAGADEGFQAGVAEFFVFVSAVLFLWRKGGVEVLLAVGGQLRLALWNGGGWGQF